MVCVIALFLAISGIICISFRLDFPHVVVLVTMTLVVSYVLLTLPKQNNIATPYLKWKTPQVVQTIMFHAALILPSLVILASAYHMDRLSRLVYSDKISAERKNIALKLGVDESRNKVPNKSITPGEQEIVERILIGADSNILKEVSIPFSLLTLCDVISENENGDVITAIYFGTPVVVKRLSHNLMTLEGVTNFKNQVELHFYLRHPNIVLLIGASYDSIANVCLVLEYMEKRDVYSLLHTQMSLRWDDPLLKIAIDAAQVAIHNKLYPVFRDLRLIFEC